LFAYSRNDTLSPLSFHLIGGPKPNPIGAANWLNHSLNQNAGFFSSAKTKAQMGLSENRVYSQL
jgi:hypothetical protein